jgi:hypothetical protein
MDTQSNNSIVEEDIEVPLLFEQQYLDAFRKNCGFPKHTRILCKSEFISWWELQKNTTRSVRTKTLQERSRRSSTEKNIMRERELKVGRALGPLICKNIEKGYSDYTLLNVFAGFTDEYDIAIVVDTRSVGNSLTEKRRKIYGFIISQYGEFKCKPNVFALNLVCAHQNAIKRDFVDNPNFGRKLVALYLCSVLRLKDASINKECVLELGGGVSNVSAFLAYIRMGFRADLAMFKDQCITDHESLPMSINLNNIGNMVSRHLTRSNRTASAPINVAIINAAIGKHIIGYRDDKYDWKKIMQLKSGDAQTNILKQIEQEYYEQLRPLVEADPTAYSESLRKHFGLLEAIPE